MPMKRILFLILAMPGFAMGAFVQSTSNGGFTSITAGASFDVNTTVGSLVTSTLFLQGTIVAPLSITDGAGSNTWTIIGPAVGANNRSYLAYTTVVEGFGSFQWNLAGIATGDMAGTEYSGMADVSTGFDCSATGSGNGTSMTTSGCSVSAQNDLIVGSGGLMDNNIDFTPGSGFTQRVEEQHSSLGNSYMMEDKTISSCGSQVADMTASGTGQWSMIMGAFKAATPTPCPSGGTPTITPSTATVFVGGQIQFATSDTVTWSMMPGSMGSINGSGLYTAPGYGSFVAKNQSAGVMLLPNDHIYNTKITTAPVDANSATRMANIGGGTGIPIQFDPAFPVNIINNATPTNTMDFFYTTDRNGSQYSIVSPPYRGVETNLYPNNYFQEKDRHQLGVNIQSGLMTEIYNYYPPGTNGSCPTCNAQSGVQWYGNSYQLPSYSGSTDAAGLYVQPLSPRVEEFRRGRIDHAMRVTLNNGYLYSGEVWPGTNHTNQCGNFTTCMPYGGRIRLNPNLNITSFSPTAQIALQAMKDYGLIFADGGPSMTIQAMTSVDMDSTTWQALNYELRFSTYPTHLDFQQIDESSLMVSSATGRVKVPNAAGISPSNYAIVVATKLSDGTSSYVYVALQPVTVGSVNTPFPPNAGFLSVMAGTPQIQIPYQVQGSSNTGVSCSMSPSIGSLTSGCLYTAPATQAGLSSTTVTITSLADSTAYYTLPLTIFPSNGIRIDVGGKAAFITDPVIPYDPAGDYGPDADGDYWWNDPIGNIPPWYSRDDMSYPQSSWPSTPPVGLSYTAYHGASDGAFAAMVPNGTYTLTLYFARDENPSGILQSLESQGQVLLSSGSFASLMGSTPYTPVTYSGTIVVSDNTFYFAMRFPDVSKFSMINAWSLEPQGAPPSISSMRAGRRFSMRGGRRFSIR